MATVAGGTTEAGDVETSDVPGAGAGVVLVSGTATGVVLFSGTATGVVVISGTATGVVLVSGTATGVVEVSGTATGVDVTLIIGTTVVVVSCELAGQFVTVGWQLVMTTVWVEY